MVVSTKVTDKVPVSEARANRLALVARLQEWYDALEASFQQCVKDKSWIELEGGKYYYVPEDSLILPNTRKVAMDATAFVKLPKLNWQEMTQAVAEKWFYERKAQNPLVVSKEQKPNLIGAYAVDTLLDHHGVEGIQKIGSYFIYQVYYGDGKAISVYQEPMKHFDYAITNTNGLKIPIYKLSEAEKSQGLRFFIEHDLPFCSGDDAQKYSLLAKICQEKLWKYTEQGALWYIDDNESYAKACQICKSAGCTDLCAPAIAAELKIDSGSATYQAIIRGLLDCDKVRGNMDSYPESILHDPAGGHWELWENGNAEHTVTLSGFKLIARNPVYDALANKSGVVGIDFGTKSTVVMYRQRRAKVLPMRVGGGRLSDTSSARDYENPTVMQLRSISDFLGAYRQYEGRPYTRWEDLIISHDAANALNCDQAKGEIFYSFFSELKQWASDKTRRITLQDTKGTLLDLPAYVELAESDFDPIEIYAYCLGLFINNMVHKIYLRYKLSFPATVEKQVRDKILASFTRGLKKSLPVQVLQDRECMETFKVEQGASEPAAYAITALKGYKFAPEGKEAYYYGIFDFGGGTADFDFGVWMSEEEEFDNYDYQISHFGQGGDPYLGGENLLEILSYHVFLSNYEELRKKEIVFIRPSWEDESAGTDYLIRQESQYARFNHKRLMEKLRGIWEGDSETRQDLQDGKLSVSLFTMNGEHQLNCGLRVDLAQLDKLLEQRVDNGVAQFFAALQNCFGPATARREIYKTEGLHIFLAGNSSKSPLVYRAFKRHIELLTAQPDGPDAECFKIYPPLGTAMSKEVLEGTLQPRIDDLIAYFDKLAGKEDESEESNISLCEKPTGKTGVAYGLLDSRVRVVQNEAEEIAFKYYIGQNRRDKFYCVINREQQYNTWVKFCTASREEFDIWFTSLSEAPSNVVPTEQIGIYCEPGFVAQPSREKSVFIRLISPTEIEYVVASEAEISENSYDAESVKRLNLQEKL